MQTARLSTSTIALRITAVRRAIKRAKLVGIVRWDLEVDRPKVQATRVIYEPGLDGWRLMVAAARGRRDKKGRRDYAIIRLLHDLGLRRSEVAGLDLDDVKRGPDGVTVWPLRKGRSERVPKPLPAETAAAVESWILFRGPADGPLFVALDPGAATERLTDRSIAEVVRVIGQAAGLPHRMAPHLLRHRHGTRGFELGVPLADMQLDMDHQDPKTTVGYHHRASDPTARIDRMIAED
jgi:integrase